MISHIESQIPLGRVGTRRRR